MPRSFGSFRLVFCLIFLSTIFMQAQKKGIYLFDSINKKPIYSATVVNKEINFHQSSDETGWVNCSFVADKNIVLKIKYLGYKTKEIILSDFDLSKNAKIYLSYEDVISLSQVDIQKKNQLSSISDLDIALRPIKNSQEILQLVPGLFIGQHAGGGKSEQIFLRGFDIDHGTDINLSVDGMPGNMVSHAHGQGYADLHFVIPETIEKVNFNKGPYFAEKGNFTTAGFVEFKTKNYLENNFAKIEVGQFDTYRGVLGINLLKSKEAEKRKHGLYLIKEVLFTNGYFDNPQDFKRLNGILKYTGQLNQNNTLTASLLGFYSKWNASGQIPDRVVNDGSIGFFGAIDPTEGGETARYNANVELLTHLGEKSTLRNQIFYSKYLFELYSNFTFFKDDPINGDQIRQKESRDLFGYNGAYQKEYYIGKLKSESKTGVQFRYDDVKDNELSNTLNRTTTLNQIKLGDVKEWNAATYFSQKIALSPNFDVTGALRLDHFDNQYFDKLTQQSLSANSTILLPKLNFDYKLTEKIKLYLYNGKGFHSNDTRVSVQNNGKKVLPPAYGSDLGTMFKIGDKLFIQTAVWYLWLDQEFVYVGDAGIVEAGGKTQRYGFDLSGRYEIAKNLFYNLDLSYAKPRALGVLSNKSYLPLAPIFTSVGGLTYKKHQGWNGSLLYRYMADRPANETNSVIAEGYFVVDAMVNYTTKKWEVGVAIQNLFNTKWKETQFETESQLKSEATPVSEIHFTPGTPFLATAKISLIF